MGRWQDGRGKLIVHGEREKLAVPLEIATSYRARTKGLLGRDAVDGALLLSPAGSVHTFRMRFPIDVAYLDHAAPRHRRTHDEAGAAGTAAAAVTACAGGGGGGDGGVGDAGGGAGRGAQGPGRRVADRDVGGGWIGR